MLTSLALATAIAHPGAPGFGFGLIFFILIPLFWVGIIALIVGLGRRRWARGGWPGYHAMATRSAEATLAERFAQGDIDEKEYRARLEVLRATPPAAPSR